MKPIISIIMSVYNQAAYLNQAINSILEQTFRDFEFIIVNDGSNDKTSTLLQQFRDSRIKIINHQTRVGLAKSLNHALKLARGLYLARMDADDVAAKNRLQTQYHFLETHPPVAVCGSCVLLINSRGKIIGKKNLPLSALAIKQTILRFNPLIHPTVMIRASALESIGQYDESLNGAEDYDLWLRLVARYPVVNINQYLLKYRLNPDGISWSNYKHTEVQAFKARLKALKSYPRWQIIYLIKPALSLLIPPIFKRLWFNVR